MKCFHCQSCGMMVFFENSRCVKCGAELGFLPDVLELSALKPAADDQREAAAPAAATRRYRNCANGRQYKICNWMVPVEDSNPFCASCRLDQTIPDLTDGRNLVRWEKLETAKRRCVYTFLTLGLPIGEPAATNRPTLRFRLLADQDNAPVKTGHENGVITVNIAEADDDERERRRLAFHEPYRTLVGHFRHESGHFYWDQLIANAPDLTQFRKLFGDERTDYAKALATYYEQGPAPDWAARTVTAYASAHPWEDWAETWAHYLHIVDTLETAAGLGISVHPEGAIMNGQEISRVTYDRRMNFDAMMTTWTPLTCALNSINRSMGLADLYPFVISPAVVDKLRFIHLVMGKAGRPVRSMVDRATAPERLRATARCQA